MKIWCLNVKRNISCVCIQLFATPWTVARQAPLLMEFPRQEYGGGFTLKHFIPLV